MHGSEEGQAALLLLAVRLAGSSQEEEEGEEEQAMGFEHGEVCSRREKSRMSPWKPWMHGTHCPLAAEEPRSSSPPLHKPK